MSKSGSKKAQEKGIIKVSILFVHIHNWRNAPKKTALRRKYTVLLHYVTARLTTYTIPGI